MTNNSTLVIIYPSILFDQIFVIYSWVIMFFNTILFLLLIGIAIKKSPKEMSSYKWYLIWNSSLLFINEISNGLSQPRFIFPYPTIVLNGVFTFFGDANIFLIKINYVILGMYSFSIVLMFLYRYDQTSPTPLAIVTTLLEKRRNLFILNFLALIFFVGTLLIPLIIANYPEEEIRALYMDGYPEIYAKIQNRSLVGLKSTPIITSLSIFLYGLFAIGIALSCLFLTYKSLRFVKHQMNINTYKLYKKLIDVLLIEILVNFVIFGVPTLVIVSAYQISQKYCIYMASISMMVEQLLPSCISILTLLHIKPYNRAIKSIVLKCLLKFGIRKFQEPAQNCPNIFFTSTIVLQVPNNRK